MADAADAQQELTVLGISQAFPEDISGIFFRRQVVDRESQAIQYCFTIGF